MRCSGFSLVWDSPEVLQDVPGRGGSPAGRAAAGLHAVLDVVETDGGPMLLSEGLHGNNL